MKIELKAIKYAAFASQETSCYSAKIYKDGKQWALVQNDGHGGPDHLSPVGRPYNDPDFWSEVKQVERDLAMTHEGIMYQNKYGSDTYQATFDLEAWCAARLDDHLMMKDLKRSMSKAAVFCKDGGIFEVKYKGGHKPDAALYESVMRQHPDARILNTMRPDEALATLQRYSA